jgi:hypothetical protein
MTAQYDLMRLVVFNNTCISTHFRRESSAQVLVPGERNLGDLLSRG